MAGGGSRCRGLLRRNCLTLAVIGYNSRMVKPEEAPKSFADLLDPKWKGKLVKAHPGYSGTIVTSTLALSKALGWEYFEKLGQQEILQVQSAVDPPRKVAQGERPVMVDGAEASALQLICSGAPIVPVYPVEGTPAVTLNGAILKQAPHPNAARLFMNFMFSREGQQIFVDYGFRSVHPGRERTIRTDALVRDQAIAHRSGGAGARRRGDQGALRALFRDVMRRGVRPERCRSSFT